MERTILRAYLSCLLLAPTLAAGLDRRLEVPLQPGAHSQEDVPLQPGGSPSATNADRPESRAALDVAPGEDAAAGRTSTPDLEARPATTDGTYRRWFVGSTFLMLGNFIPNDKNPPDFVQLNVGYRITPRDVVFLELKRSRFGWPLGIPWGKSFDAPGENYPGYVRQNVIGLAYNRFWWKGLYTAVHAMSAFQKYYGEDRKFISNGFTLFMTYRLGYQVSLFENRFFIEPSVGLTHWPVKTHTPRSFELTEEKWPSYFGWEPGLHFGFNL